MGGVPGEGERKWQKGLSAEDEPITLGSSVTAEPREGPEM